MNEIFNTLRDKFPFLSLIRKGDLEYVGIVQNEDANVIKETGQEKNYPIGKKTYLISVFQNILFKILGQRTVRLITVVL
jgi:hypothetical protein